jgi:alpha-beta hydrolase superfamily lysophospholipase
LAAAGFASLRYDPRGRGQSGGVRENLSLAALRADAVAAWNKLATIPEVDTSRLYIISLGAGSFVASTLVEAPSPTVRGYVALAPAIKDLEAVLIYSTTSHLKAAGLSNNYINHQKKPLQDTIAAIKGGSHTEPTWRGLPVGLWQELLSEDLTATLSALAGPILVLQGSEDLEIPLEQRQAAELLGTTKANLTVMELMGLGYTLAQASKADLWESALLPFEVAPGAILAITGWLKQN